jgi:hypothetical protein
MGWRENCAADYTKRRMLVGNEYRRRYNGEKRVNTNDTNDTNGMEGELCS